MTVVTDSFNRANETPLSGGGVWTAGSGSAGINLISNSCTPNVLGSDAAFVYTGASFGNDQYAQANLTCTGTAGSSAGLGLLVRSLTAAKTFYWFVTDHAASSNCEIGKFNAGVHATIGALFTQAWTDTDLWRLEVSGSTLTVKLNGTTVTTRSDSSITSGGGPGLAYSSVETAATWDNFEGGDLSVAPPIRFNPIPFMGR